MSTSTHELHPRGTLSELLGNNARKVADLAKVKQYVKTKLFPRMIFMFDDEQMKEGSWMYKDYMTNCRDLVGLGTEDNVDEEDHESYMNHLWTIMERDKSYKQWLATKRSNTYQAVQDKFMRKYDQRTHHRGITETLTESKG